MREAQARCDAYEFQLWKEYYRLEPWGEERADLRSGIVASILVNTNRKRNARPVSPAAFLLDAERKPPREESWEEQRADVIAFTRRLGGDLQGVE